MTTTTAMRQPPKAILQWINPFVGILATAAATLTILAARNNTGAPDARAAGFFILLTLAARFGIDFRHRDEILTVQLYEAILAPAILVLPTGTLALLTIGAHTIAETSRRVRPVKAVFNVAQWTLTTITASTVVHQFALQGRGLPRVVLPLIVAMTAGAVVNTAAFVAVMRLARTERVRDVIKSNMPAITVGWLVNFAFGLLFTAAQATHPGAIALFAVPLVVLHLGFRGYAGVLSDKRQLAGLHAATEALAAPMNPKDALPLFLTEVRKCFDGDSVELILSGEDTVRVVDADGVHVRPATSSPVAVVLSRHPDAATVSAGDVGEVASLLRGRRSHDCISAPLVGDARLLGTLIVYDRGGVASRREGEQAVLSAIARAAAAAVQKATLLENILEERKKLSDIVDYASDGILTANAEGTILTWNPAFERMTGYTTAAVAGVSSLAALRPRDETGRDVWLERWPQRVAELPAELQITTAAGEARSVGCSYTVLPDAFGRPGTLIMVARDETEARNVARMREDFVAAVSHELRTPLTPIKGFANTLLHRGEELDAQARHSAVLSIARQADRLERLITNLLEMTKVERGAGGRPDEAVDPAAAVAKVVADVRAMHLDREIDLELPLEAASASGDTLWIEQIVANLLSNAIKYSPTGTGVGVRVVVAEAHVEVSVTDSGAGIPPADRERVFERFHRLSDDMTRSTGGAGIGLYISRHLARLMNGDLVVAPSVSGAHLLLTIPRTHSFVSA